MFTIPANKITVSTSFACLAALPILLFCWIGNNTPGPRRQRREEREERRRQKALRYEPVDTQTLPTARARRLTNQENQQPQSQCMLFDKLPAEIRLIIWECVLDRHSHDGHQSVIHMDLGDGTLRFVPCLEPNFSQDFGRTHVCWRSMTTKSYEALQRSEDDDGLTHHSLGLSLRHESTKSRAEHGRIIPRWKLNPLLLTCKLM